MNDNKPLLKSEPSHESSKDDSPVMITMDGAPNLLPHKSWNEVSPVELQPIASVNQRESVPIDTNTATASGRSWKNKTIVGIKLGTIVAIILFVLKCFGQGVQTHYRKVGLISLHNMIAQTPAYSTYDRTNIQPFRRTNFLRSIEYPKEMRRNPFSSGPNRFFWEPKKIQD